MHITVLLLSDPKTCRTQNLRRMTITLYFDNLSMELLPVAFVACFNTQIPKQKKKSSLYPTLGQTCLHTTSVMMSFHSAKHPYHKLIPHLLEIMFNSFNEMFVLLSKALNTRLLKNT